ncbi:MAG: hypothetical protein HZA53_09915 [Planctomycetes bacterium]|nr:hypothetical protein [Planctomycetota bacterium]
MPTASVPASRRAAGSVLTRGIGCVLCVFPSFAGAQQSGTQPHGAASDAPQPLVRRARDAQLAGRALLQYPFFEFVGVSFTNAPVQIAIDPTRFPEVAGATVDVWILAHRTPAEWDANPVLVDARGAPDVFTLGTTDVQSCTFTTAGVLSGDAGLDLGVGYDVVVDVDRDGRAGPVDLIDGYGIEAGFYRCMPTALPGPLAVTEVLYSGGTWLGEDIYYPTNIAALGQLPLVVVSHGNGHNYTWYDHIGTHLASWGCIVMSHTNDTVPGIETASTTTLTNTDHFLGNLATIAGGVMNGHVDGHKIVWIGHSRGGEGVCRAYDRIFDGTYTPVRYTLADIKLISSIAPTDFLGITGANPHGANYHLWVGGADSDVTGCASNDIACSYPLLQRSTSYHQSIEFHGAGHGAFHADAASSLWATGPCLLTRAEVNTMMKAYLLPLVQRYVNGNLPAREFLWRQWEVLQSPGVPTNTCVVVDLQYIEPPAAGNRVIDDFQTNTATDVSSSGAPVTFDVTLFNEGRLDDPNADFTYSASAPFNGMTEATASDTTRGIVFQWTTDRFLVFNVPAAWQDTSGYEYLSFRACQVTRAPETTAALGDLDFTVVLLDGHGNESSVRVFAYGGGVEEPYQRTSCGTGAGWNNEWETIRIRMQDFTRNGASIDLGAITDVGFRFGPTWGSAVGRLGFDDLQFMLR